MPAKRKTRVDRVAAKFGELYRIGKARSDLTEAQITTMLGFKSRDALLRRRNNPLLIDMGQLMTLGAAFRWSEEDWQQLIETMRGGKAS